MAGRATSFRRPGRKGDNHCGRHDRRDGASRTHSNVGFDRCTAAPARSRRLLCIVQARLMIRPYHQSGAGWRGVPCAVFAPDHGCPTHSVAGYRERGISLRPGSATLNGDEPLVAALELCHDVAGHGARPRCRKAPTQLRRDLGARHFHGESGALETDDREIRPAWAGRHSPPAQIHHGGRPNFFSKARDKVSTPPAARAPRARARWSHLTAAEASPVSISRWARASKVGG